MERTHRRPLENSLTLALIADALRKEVVAVVREQLAAGERLTVDAVVDEVLALHDDGEQDLLGDEDPKPADDFEARGRQLLTLRLRSVGTREVHEPRVA